MIAGSDISGKGGTHLKAEGKVNIEAVDENHLERSQNKSSGFNFGVAIQFGNSVSAGITAGGNVAKGYGNGESQAWVGVGSKDSLTTIESGEETNIIGSQVKGKRIEVTAKELNIESLQDTAKYEGKQQSASGQVTVGYGASGSASYNQSKMKADYASVNTQAGLFAGDEGYDVNVQNQTNLKGGIITSTQEAEDTGKNRFSTGTLNYSNIANHANYKGNAFGASGGISANFETPLGDKGIAQSNKTVKDKDGNQVLAKGADSLQVGMNLGYGSDSDSQSSQTKSGINTKNLIIRDEQAQFERTGKTAEQIKAEIKTDITTDTAENRSGKLDNNFDKAKLEKELDYQVKATKEFQSITRASINEKISSQAESKRQEAEQAKQAGDLAKASELEKEAEKWEMGGAYRQGVDAITNAVGLALGGSPTEGVVAGAVSPYMNTVIKEATTNENGEVNKPANLLAHAVLGAIEAKATGNNALAGAVAGATSEATAMLLTQGKSVKDLTESEKQNVVVLSQLASGLAGAVVGDSAQNAVVGAEIGKRAVENNTFGDLHPSDDRKQSIEVMAKAMFGGDEEKAEAYYDGMKQGEAKAFADNLSGSIEAVTEIDKTVSTLADILNSKVDDVVDKVVVSAQEWNEQLDRALETDPKLAGELVGYAQSQVKSLQAPSILLTGQVAESFAKVVKAGVDKFGTLNLKRGVLSNKEVGIEWGPIGKQGKAWEAYLQKTLPEGTLNLNEIKPNFKTFDHLLPNGTAISAKTMDTKNGYKDPKRITYQLNKYVDDMVNFKSDGRNGFTIINEEISYKEIYLAIPSGISKEKMQAINHSIGYAQSLGVKIIVKEVK